MVVSTDERWEEDVIANDELAIVLNVVVDDGEDVTLAWLTDDDGRRIANVPVGVA